MDASGWREGKYWGGAEFGIYQFKITTFPWSPALPFEANSLLYFFLLNVFPAKLTTTKTMKWSPMY